jgi:hypothetical protein
MGPFGHLPDRTSTRITGGPVDLQTVVYSTQPSPSPDASPSRRPLSVWRRVQEALISEFGLARCEERLTHIQKNLIVRLPFLPVSSIFVMKR